MTGSEIQDLLVAALARQHGGSARSWRMAIGPVRVHDVSTHPLCNWSVAPSGSVRENAAIEHLLDTVRLTHPMVTGT
jgi:hypothetical protein